MEFDNILGIYYKKEKRATLYNECDFILTYLDESLSTHQTDIT